MVCLYCGGETKVVNSRLQRRNNQVWRRRQCMSCQFVLTTHEAVDLESAISVSKDGLNQPFMPALLQNALSEALKHRKDAYTASGELLGTIVRKLLTLPGKPLYRTTDIAKVTADVLKRFDKQAHLRYLADHPSLQ